MSALVLAATVLGVLAGLGVGFLVALAITRAGELTRTRRLEGGRSPRRVPDWPFSAVSAG